MKQYGKEWYKKGRDRAASHLIYAAGKQSEHRRSCGSWVARSKVRASTTQTSRAHGLWVLLMRQYTSAFILRHGAHYWRGYGYTGRLSHPAHPCIPAYPCAGKFQRFCIVLPLPLDFIAFKCHKPHPFGLLQPFFSVFPAISVGFKPSLSYSYSLNGERKQYDGF